MENISKNLEISEFIYFVLLFCYYVLCVRNSKIVYQAYKYFLIVC